MRTTRKAAMSTTLLKSLTIVEYLARTDRPQGISETARALDLDKSAVQRVFQTLHGAGYLERVEGSSKYRLSLRLWELGAQIIGRHDIRRLVHPILRFGARLSGFTAFFTLADFPSVLYLDKVEGVHGRTYSAEPGHRVPIHWTASGKAVLAFLGDLDLDRLSDGPHAATEGRRPRPTDRAALAAELAEIRSQMYAVSESGSIQGVNSVAAPVWHAEAVPVGSVVLTAAASKMPAERFEEFGQTVISMADEATRSLGGTFRGGAPGT